MSDFKAKMHRNRFRLGSTPDPAGELTALPRPSWNKGTCTSKGGEEEEKEEHAGQEGSGGDCRVYL